MWPDAEGRWIHFTMGVSSYQCHLYDTPLQKKGVKTRYECENINDLISFVSIRKSRCPSRISSTYHF